MTRMLSSSDILNLISKERHKIDLSEGGSIPVFAGSGDRKVPLVGKGFKIRHKDSGYTYTCVKLVDDGNKSTVIVQDDGVGDYHAIPSEDLSKYERM